MANIAYRLESEWSQTVNSTSTQIIYHYTDPAGLIGIVSDGQLWVTDIRYLNDSSELLYALDILKDALNATDSEFGTESFQIGVAVAARERKSLFNDLTDTYVTCFSQEDDLLSQWSLYGSRGSGFSIGFDRTKLEQVISPEPHCPESSHSLSGIIPPVKKLVRIRYEAAEQTSDLRRIFDRFVEALPEAPTNLHISQCGQAVVDSAARSASLFKHPCFAHEKEWRIIISGLGGMFQLHFRASLRTPIPYIKTVKVPLLPIVSITIGPTLHQDLSHRSVQKLLYDKGYNNVVIKRSSLPFAMHE